MSVSRENDMGSTLSVRPRQSVLLMKIAVVFAVAGVVGCATDPGETTAIGTAAGGVIGAGLGAIVGNQTGDAGAGLAIGTVAGATAGALIGNEFEAQEERLAYQNERLARQDERLKAGRREIESLRGAGDVDASRDWSSAGRESKAAPLERSTAGYATSSSATTRSGAQDYSTTARASRRDVVRGAYRAPVAERDLTVDSNGMADESAGIKSGETGLRERSEIPSASRRKDSSSPSSIFAPSGSGSVAGSASSSGFGSAGSRDSDEGARLPSSTNNSKASRAGLISEGEPVVMSGDTVSTGSREQVAGALPSSRRAAVPEGDTFGPESGNIEAAKVERPREVMAEREPTTSNAASASTGTSKEVSSVGSAKIGGSEGCTQAEQEMRKADNVSETPDKLFHYRRALRLCPSRPEYHVKLGDLYLSLKRRSDAQYEFEEALRAAPTYQVAQDRLRSLKGSD